MTTTGFTARGRMEGIAAGLAALVVASVAVLPLPVEAQASNPAQAGFSAQRLQRVDQFIERTMQAGEISGGVTLIARNGKIVAYGTHFWVDPEKKMVAILMLQTPGQPRTGDFETAVMQALMD
jgi:CubicO group peptidase (beta-lactamase class C family)